MTSAPAPNVGSMWGDLILFTMLVIAGVHLLYGCLSIRQLVFKDPKALFIPLIFFIVGAFYAFVSLALPALAISVVHQSVGTSMSVEERSLYGLVMSALVTYFSCGRTSNLYAM